MSLRSIVSWWNSAALMGIGKASAYVDGKCAATAELTFVLTEANAGA